MDFHGCYYALSPFLVGATGNTNDALFADGFPRLDALANHSRTTTDFANFAGKLWLGHNGSSMQVGNKYPNGGQSQSILLGMDSTDHLLSTGSKPRGRGHWWRATSVVAGTPSDMMHARGYDRRVVWFKNATGAGPVSVTVTLYVDAAAHAFPTKLTVADGALGYLELPAGANIDWLTLTTDKSGLCSAWLDVA